MDFEMPYAQKHAWDNLKEAVNDYAEVTGSEIAVVTSFQRSTFHPGAGDGLRNTENDLALHGHGNLLLQLRQCLEQIKIGLEIGRDTGARRRSPFSPIPVPVKAEEDYHSQAMARSLTSSFQSLKLDHRASGPVPVQSAAHSGGRRNIPHSGRRNSHGNRRKNEAVNGDKADILELDENLLFEEQHAESGRSPYSDSEDEDFNSGDEFPCEAPHYQQQQRNFMQIAPPEQPNNASRYGTSLPVNINMNFARKHDGASRLHNPVAPSAQSQVRATETVVIQANRPRHGHRGYEDTPNHETMMASMQALARSVTDDSALIFGERPRPRLNTGETRGFLDRHK